MLAGANADDATQADQRWIENQPQMNADLKHGLITDKILGVFYEVYNELGHGFLESVYHRSLVLALESVGLKVCSRIDIPVWLLPIPDLHAGSEWGRQVEPGNPNHFDAH